MLYALASVSRSKHLHSNQRSGSDYVSSSNTSPQGKKHMNKNFIGRLIGLSLICLAGSASASTVYTGTVIAEAHFGGWTAAHLLDQSGLSAGYTNGFTNFETYVASGPTHIGTSTSTANGYFSPAAAQVDVDLGATLKLTKFALWNDNDYQGVENFNLQIADNPGFVGAVSLGSFIASYGPLPTDYGQPVPVQEFDLTDATGRYVRINFFDDHFNSGVINVGEVIFGVGELSTVPEPSALLLMCAGIAGLRLNSRRGKSTNKTSA